MPHINADALLLFTATDNGSTLTPTSNFIFNSVSSGSTSNFIFDDGDGNADTGTDYYQNGSQPYSGYTININGNEYAIFEIPGAYIIPRANTTDDFFALHGTAIAQTITNAGDNANVVNICFLEGTQIATPSGEAAVENLEIGAEILTREGKTVTVKWIGRQRVATPVNVTTNEKRAPVCITAGALGNHSDLYVSADHGMIVDELVINASALVNGDTIRFVPASELPAEFTYYHIETEAHDVILANGAASETFIDAAGRAAFDNHQEYLDLYGVERIIPEMDRPRISSARLVPKKIKERLSDTHSLNWFAA